MPGDEEQKDEQALGHLAMLALRSLFKGPQGVLLSVLSVYLGLTTMLGMTPWHGRSAHAPDMLSIIKDIQTNVVEIKITNKAILTTLPKAQKAEAEKMIALQMQALAMMRVKDAP